MNDKRIQDDIDYIVKNSDGGGYIIPNKESSWTIENSVRDYLIRQYKEKGRKALAIRINGKEVIIPVAYKEEYGDRGANEFIKEFYGHQRAEVKKALKAFNNGYDSGGIGFIKIDNVFVPITPDMKIKPATEEETRNQVFNHYYEKNYLNMYYGAFLDSYYNLNPETLEDKVVALVEKGIEKLTPYAQQMIQEYNAIGVKVTKELWNADWGDMSRKELMLQSVKTIKETMKTCASIAKQVALKQKDLDPNTMEAINANIAYLRKFGVMMQNIAQKSQPIYNKISKHLNATYNSIADKIGEQIKNTNMPLETQIKLMSIVAVTGTTLSVAANVDLNKDNKVKGNTFLLPNGEKLQEPRDSRKVTDDKTYDATADIMGKQEKSKKQNLEEENARLDTKLAEAERLVKEAAALNAEKEKDMAMLQTLEPSKLTLNVDAPAVSEVKIPRIEVEVPLTKENKNKIKKAQKQQEKDDKAEKKLAEKKKAEDDKKKKQSILAEAKANQKGDRATAERIRNIREGTNLLMATVAKQAHLQPIYKNPLPKSLLDSLNFDISRKLSDNQKNNRNICISVGAHMIADELGADHKHFSELVMASVAMAHNESAFDEKVKAKKSSATGLYQPLNATFLEDVYNNKDAYATLMQIDRKKLDNIVMVVKKNKTVEYQVKDAALKKKILDKRKDPYVNAYFGTKHMLENLEYAEKQLGKELKPSEYGIIYQIHHFGRSGWNSMRKKSNQNVNKKSKEAKANTWMVGLTFGQVLNKTSKMYMDKYTAEASGRKKHFENLALQLKEDKKGKAINANNRLIGTSNDIKIAWDNFNGKQPG